MIKIPVKCPNCQKIADYFVTNDDITFVRIDEIHKQAVSFHLNCEICRCEFFLNQTGERYIVN